MTHGWMKYSGVSVCVLCFIRHAIDEYCSSICQKGRHGSTHAFVVFLVEKPAQANVVLKEHPPWGFDAPIITGATWCLLKSLKNMSKNSTRYSLLFGHVILYCTAL